MTGRRSSTRIPEDFFSWAARTQVNHEGGEAAADFLRGARESADAVCLTGRGGIGLS